jgi:hypothetical protein
MPTARLRHSDNTIGLEAGVLLRDMQDFACHASGLCHGRDRLALP